MRRKYQHLTLFALLLFSSIAFGQTITTVAASSSNPVGFVLLKPTNYNPANKYALWVFLHGVGGRGPATDSSLYNFAYGIPNGSGGRWDPELPKELQAACQQRGFVILAPQISGDWGTAEGDAMVAYAKASLSIDWTTNRNVITGLSLGGGGTWRYVSSSVARAQNFATAIVVCGLNWISSAQTVASANLGIWAFHAKNDGTVAYSNATSARDAVNALGPRVPVHLTSYPDGDHYIWGRVYSQTPLPGIDGETQNVYDYAAANRVGAPTAVAVPVVNPTFTARAGNDTIVTQPNINLNGLASSKGWTAASWGVITVPPGVNIYSPIVTSGGGWITATATLPVPGQYVFRLTIKNATAMSTDDITVTLATAPKYIVSASQSLQAGVLTLTINYSDGTTQTMTFK